MKNTVTVKLTVTIEVGGSWRDDCTLQQVKKQAKEEALALARRALEKDPMVKAINTGEVTLSAVI